MTLPTFMIIGAAKAGTTSLHFYLAQHPEIQMSANKEPNFFAGPPNGVPFPPRHVGRIGDYEALFDARFAVRGEASTGYTNHPRRTGVAQRIKRMIPDAKLIYLVRDPVERTISHYHDALALGKLRDSLEAALGEFSPENPLLCHSRYATQLELYLQHFPAEQILVVDQADMRTDRRASLRRIFEFLGVDSGFDSVAFERTLHASEGRPVYSPRCWAFVERLVVPRAQLVPAGSRRRLRQAFERGLLPKLEPADVEADLRMRLSDLFRAEVRRLRELTGEDFATWCV